MNQTNKKKPILCRMGFHSWTYSGYDPHQIRTCIRVGCGKTQTAVNLPTNHVFGHRWVDCTITEIKKEKESEDAS